MTLPTEVRCQNVKVDRRVQLSDFIKDAYTTALATEGSTRSESQSCSKHHGKEGGIEAAISTGHSGGVVMRP